MAQKTLPCRQCVVEFKSLRERRGSDAIPHGNFFIFVHSRLVGLPRRSRQCVACIARRTQISIVAIVMSVSLILPLSERAKFH
jgi:hypothetical protein